MSPARQAWWVVACLGLAGLTATACSSAAEAVGPFPQPGALLAVDWRVDLVDNGFFGYAPTELGRVALSPDGRAAYVGTSDGRLVATDAHSGRVMWELAVGEPVDGEGAVDRGTVYFGAADGRFRAVDAAGGGVLWTYDVGGNLDGTPALTDDRVIFTDPDGTVVCLDRRTGSVVWTYDDNDPVLSAARGLHPPIKGQASPLVREGRVYAGFPSGRLAALDLASGAALWTADLAGDAVRHTDVDEMPVWADGHILAVSFANGLHALDAQGHIEWRAELEGATRPVVLGDRVLTTTVDGGLHVLDLATGESQLAVQLQDRAPGRVELLGNRVLVPTSHGGLYVLDPESGDVLARFNPDSGFASVAVRAPNQIVAYDNEGFLHGLTLRAL